MSRRKSRILAFQGLYSFEVGKIPLDEILKFDWNFAEPDDRDSEDSSEKESEPVDSIVFARMIVSGTIEHLEEIDGIIKNHLKTWDIERVNKVSLSILRMSVYSLKYQTDIQPSIVIDEAIHIAKEFGPDGSFKFVNAILDNIKKFLNGERAD